MKTLLFNPFKRYNERQLLLFGLATASIGIVFATLTNTHFDGVMDTHFGKSVSFKTALLQSLINCISVLLIFYPMGKWINSKTRLIDIINLSLIIKIPSYFLMLLNINGWAYNKSETFLEVFADPFNIQLTSEIVSFIAISALFAIFAFVWLIILFYNGLKEAIHLKGLKHIILFVIAIIVAEIISKGLLTFLWKI